MLKSMIAGIRRRGTMEKHTREGRSAMEGNFLTDLSRLAEQCALEKEFIERIPTLVAREEAERIVALEFTSLSRFYAWVWQNKKRREKLQGQGPLDRQRELPGEERDRLIKELEARLFELDELEKTIIPNLLDIYHLKIGIHDLERQRLEYENRKTLAVISAIRDALSRGERPSFDALEKSARLSLEELNTKLKGNQKKIERARIRSSSLLSPQDSREFKKLYRRLVNKLHPELHPSQAEREKALWIRMQQAYGRGDIEELRLLDVLAADLKEASPGPGSTRDPYEALSDMELKKNLDDVVTKIKELKNTFPYSLKEQLLDHSWVEARIRAIGKKIDEELKLREMCQSTLKEVRKALEK